MSASTERRKKNERAFRTLRRKQGKIAGRQPARDRGYLSWMASQPCCVTGEWPATTHHVRFCGSPKNDRRTIRLVARLQMLTHEKPGRPCIERLGKAKFEARYGINIEALIASYNLAYKELQEGEA